jgi:hypothetical protein
MSRLTAKRIFYSGERRSGTIDLYQVMRWADPLSLRNMIVGRPF